MARSRLSCVNTVDDREKAHAAEKKDDFGSGPLKPDIFLSSFHPFFFLSQPLTFLPLNVHSQPPASVKIPNILFFVGLLVEDSFRASSLASCFLNICPPQMLALTRVGLQRASCVLAECAYLQGGGGMGSSHSHLNEVIASRRRRRWQSSHRCVRNGWAGPQ